MYERLFDRYSILEKISEGGEGEVYKALDEHLKCTVAIKKCIGYGQTGQVFCLVHENLPRILDVIRDDEVTYLVMEYVEGETLAQVVESRKLEVDRVLEITLGICSAVVALHNNSPSIIHGDLNPYNIIIEKSGTVKVLDYDKLDCTTEYKGMVGFAGPEQYGYGTVDVKTDVYGIGCLMYYMLTGKYAVENEKGAIDRVDELNPLVTSNMVAVVHKCLQPVKQSRYMNVTCLIGALRRVNQVECDNTVISVYEDVPMAINFAKAVMCSSSGRILLVTLNHRTSVAELFYPDILGNEDFVANNAAAVTEIAYGSSCGIDVLCPVVEFGERIYYLGLGRLDGQAVRQVIEKCSMFDYIFIVFDSGCVSGVLETIGQLSNQIFFSSGQDIYSVAELSNAIKFLSGNIKITQDRCKYVVKNYVDVMSEGQESFLKDTLEEDLVNSYNIDVVQEEYRLAIGNMMSGQQLLKYNLLLES